MLKSSARSVGSPSTACRPSSASVRMLVRSAAGGGGGSGVRISASEPADHRNVSASMKMAAGPLKICTSQPATPNEPTSATDCEAASLLLPSTKSARSGSRAGSCPSFQRPSHHLHRRASISLWSAGSLALIPARRSRHRRPVPCAASMRTEALEGLHAVLGEPTLPRAALSTRVSRSPRALWVRSSSCLRRGRLASTPVGWA